MRFHSRHLNAWGLILVCGSAFALAGGCGSDDGKKAVEPSEAGAAGANEGGGPSSGGSSSTAGSPGDAGAGQAGAEVAGAGGVPAAGGNAAAGEFSAAGAGGAPSACVPDGTVAAFSLLTEPIYQGCRGGLVRVQFSTDQAAQFTCCGVSTSAPSFAAQLPGSALDDSGGDLLLEVPLDAPIGTYGMNLDCPTVPNEHAFSLEINDAGAPIVSSITSTLVQGDLMVITGENLDTVTNVTATRVRDGAFGFCYIDGPSQTATSLSCGFESIEASADQTDVYVLEASNELCGSAVNRLPFTVVVPAR